MSHALSSFFDLGDDRVFYEGLSDLDGLATHFVKRTYLEDLHVLPRGQDIPRDALTMTPRSVAFISHPWLDAYRADDAILGRIRSFIPNHEGIGVWIDYCCLPQRRRDGVDDRSEREKELFKTQLQYIPICGRRRRS